jgi:cephalosporin hydroxylase
MARPSHESLHRLAVIHGTDKGREPSLARVYEPFLTSVRTDAIGLIEIGAKDGASLRMWRDFFPRGEICGIDNNEGALAHAGDRIHIVVGDQADPAVVGQAVDAVGRVDVVVDDGGHHAHEQVASLLALWPAVRPGGLYIVEDIHTSYMLQYGMRYRDGASTVEVLKGIIDDIHWYWHAYPTSLDHVDSIHFFERTCLLRKRAEIVPRGRWPGIGSRDWAF